MTRTHQVRIHGPHDVSVDEVDAREPGERDVVVRVAACGICGSDLTLIKWGMTQETGEPLPLGHEFSGIVEAVGASVTGVVPGDRVVVHPGGDELGRIGCGTPEGGLGPRVVVSEADHPGRLHLVPDGLDLVVAALAEPAAVGMHAVEQAEAGAEDKVVIFGAGPVGLCALGALVDLGNHDVIVVDLSAQRLALARGLGAALALDPAEGDVWEAIGERHGTGSHLLGPTVGTDAYIEATGAASVVTQIVAHARPDSRVSVVAVHTDDVSLSLLAVMTKQLTIRGSMEYPDRFEAGLELLARRDLSSLITHRFGLDQVPEALEVLSGSRDCGKVMITHPV